MDDLADGLAVTSNESPADTPATPDEALASVFDAPSEDAATSDPSEPAPAESQPAAATAQPQQETAPESGVKGEPPRERWDAILTNARQKARDETLAEYRDRLEIVERLRSDLPGTLAQLLEEGAADPRFSEQLTSRAAAILAARKQQGDGEPTPDLQTSDGELVYSAKQQAKRDEWRERQLEQRLGEQFKPLRELQERFTQHQQVQRMTQEAASVAEERGQYWKQMPFFEDHKAAILSRQAEIYAEIQQAAQRGERRFDPTNTPWDALTMAYREVVSTQAIPKLQSQQTDSLVAQAARKRAGSSSDPAASAPAQPRKPRTEDEALDQGFGLVS